MQVFAYFLAFIILGGCNSSIAAISDQNTAIDLQLRWHHQFQFAGYYAAVEKGYYRDEGMDVRLHVGDPDHQPVSEVLAGRAQYGVGNSEVLYQRLLGKPLVALAAIFQCSPSVLLTRQDSGIHSVHDLVGKKVMLMNRTEDADFLTMLESEGISPSQINIIPSSYNIDDLISGKVDAFNSYLTNEPYYLKQNHLLYNIIDPSSYRIEFYSDILFTSETELQEHPDRVEAFRRASLKGWEYAMNHPNEIIDLLINKYHVNKIRDHLEFEAAEMRKLIFPGLIEIGHMNPVRWHHMADTFVSAGLIKPNYSLDGLIYDTKPKVLPEWFLAALIATISLITAVLFISYYLLRLNRKLAFTENSLRIANEQLHAKINHHQLTEVALRQSELRYKHQARIDYLTGIPNRRHFMERAELEFTRNLRYGGTLSLLMLDLDHFKKINDNYGHLAGDQVLQKFSTVSQATLRDMDVIGRLGGEEFAILLPETGKKETLDMAERLRELIANTTVELDQGFSIQFTVSIGAASQDKSCANLAALIIEADQELYKAKADGRNRVYPLPP